MENLIYPWQQPAWDQLRQLFPRLPHAILLHGAAGTGKTAFAEHVARSLLCQTPVAEGHACGVCEACGWFAQYSHPDYRRVRPEIFDEDASADGDEAAEAEPKKAAKSTKAPSKDIRIEQIRALAGFMNISTHRNGMRVVLLYPAENLNTASANALLKTLEEPPPRTLILLVCNRVDRLLPTILSRCRKLTVPAPSRQEALAWLQERGVKNAEIWLAEQGGAPLAALARAQAGDREVLDDFLLQLTRPGRESALATAERLQKAPVPELVAWLQRWLFDVFSCKLSGTIRYYPQYRKQLDVLAARAEVHALLNGLQAITQRRAVAEHPLSARLFIEDMLLDYARIFS